MPSYLLALILLLYKGIHPAGPVSSGQQAYGYPPVLPACHSVMVTAKPELLIRVCT